MKKYNVRLTFTDRHQGPGIGRSISVEATSFPGAIGKAARDFWRTLNTKQRNDVRRDGLKISTIEEKAIDSGSES
jgi:hypothetical protein